MNYEEYWRENSFELATRVRKVRELLQLQTAPNTNYIRVGSAGDGGYLLANDIDNSHVVSYGVDNNVDFELELATKYGCTVSMYDHSIDKLPVYVPNSVFFKEKVGPENIDETLAGLDNIVLKLDIEGSEWDALAACTQLHRANQITMEAHWMTNLVYEPFYNAVVHALENVSKTHFPVFVHANNDQPLLVMGAQPIPNVFEVLFLNRTAYEAVTKKDPFYNLTSPNNPNFPEIGLSFP